MKHAILTILAATLISMHPSLSSAANDSRCFEMRVYYAAEGKLDALNARFRDHTCALFEKHGMENIGYWMPVENPERKLVYLLAYPSREAREKSWKNFMADPAWQKAWKESEKDGKLVAKAESYFLSATDYSPTIKPALAASERVFELRTYTASPGNLGALDARFRDHTVNLFSKHGMEHVGYWHLASGSTMGPKGGLQNLPENTLIYLLAHKSREAADASFKAFREDPLWVSARKASEEKAGGSLTTKDGVKSVFMKPTDYSQTR